MATVSKPPIKVVDSRKVCSIDAVIYKKDNPGVPFLVGVKYM